ncbi:peptidoglycan-binding protein [Profundibacter sp.]|uniref:peptidoglycan-binding protein n=1 Tax=Profundibacter sp. TaxID=3101071 RepID=UPI003D09F438
MMLKLKQVALAGALGILAMPVLAKDVALVIGNRDYQDQPAIRGFYFTQDGVQALKRAGFRVFAGEDLDSSEQITLASKFYAAIDQADRVVVLLGGHFVSNDRDGWLLASDARNPNAFTVGQMGVSVGAILDAAGQKPGGAIVMVGQSDSTKAGSGLKAGMGDLEIPQGVTLVKGPMGGLLQLLSGDLLKPGNSVANTLEQAPRGVTVEGFVAKRIPFIPAEGTIPDQPQDAEYLYLEAVREIGTVSALESYLNRYPNGRYAGDVRREISDLRAQPELQAKADEANLKLTREQRRQIQRNLSILGFNPHGIDGLFGRGSRAAIGAWQKSRGIDGYGYLTGNQISALQAAADVRSRELEEEARKRQEEQDRLDASYWRRTGRDGTEDGLRAYLKRYPDGLYSDIAHQRLERYDDERRAEAAAAERDYWDDVRAEGTVGAYKRYLRDYPRGVFAADAKEKLAELQGDTQNAELIRRAKAEEARVAGNGIVRLLVEQKLQELGLKPGRIDGRFDDKTRRAVRKFQRTRKIPVTGYVTQKTIVRLLAAR